MTTKPFILRQLAIAMTKAGEIGDDADLLFTGERDLQNFAIFTSNTVMLMGRNTANQLLQAGVYPTPFRPWVVLTKSGKSVSTTATSSSETPWKKYLAYAQDFNLGVAVARHMVDESASLFGVTVVGGKAVYEEALDRMTGSSTFNHVYLHTMFDALAGNQFLSVNAENFIKAVQKNQVTPALTIQTFMSEAHIKGVSPTMGASTYRWLYDANSYNPTRIQAMGNRGSKLKISTTGDNHIFLDLRDVAMYEMPMDYDKAIVTLKSGTKFDIRMDVGRPGLRHLEILINKFWSNE